MVSYYLYKTNINYLLGDFFFRSSWYFNDNANHRRITVVVCTSALNTLLHSSIITHSWSVTIETYKGVPKFRSCSSASLPFLVFQNYEGSTYLILYEYMHSCQLNLKWKKQSYHCIVIILQKKLMKIMKSAFKKLKSTYT